MTRLVQLALAMLRGVGRAFCAPTHAYNELTRKSWCARVRAYMRANASTLCAHESGCSIGSDLCARARVHRKCVRATWQREFAPRQRRLRLRQGQRRISDDGERLGAQRK